MITSTRGRWASGAGTRRLLHHSSQSGMSIIVSSRQTAYSGRNTCHAVVRFEGSDKNAYTRTSTATAASSAHQATTVSHGQRRRVTGTTVARGSAKLVNV